MGHAMNDNRKQNAADNGVGSGELVSCLVAFERPDGTECLMEVEAPSLNFAAGVAVEKLTGYKINWAMKTSGELAPLSRFRKALARFFLRYS